MTREHALLQLLRLGPLPMREVVEITGWRRRACWSALAPLMSCGRVRRLRGWPCRYVAVEVSPQ